jgi:hypothetical protein
MKLRRIRTASLMVALMWLSGIMFSSVAKPRRLPPQIVDLVLKDACTAGCPGDDIATYKRNLKFEMHDLNGDKVPEFFVYINHTDWCGASFNCEYWVFQRQRNSYRMIAGGYPVLRVASTVTNGFSDLESQGHKGGCTLANGSWGREIYLTVLKYTGKEYRPTEIGERCRESK